MNEIRNELLIILKLMQVQNEDDKKLNVDWLLERFEIDIKNQLKDLEYKQKELNDNLQLVQHVRKELGIDE